MKESLIKEIEKVAERVERYQEVIRDNKKEIEFALKNYKNVGMLNNELAKCTRQIDAYMGYLNTAEQELIMIQNIAIHEELKEVFLQAQAIQETMFVVD